MQNIDSNNILMHYLQAAMAAKTIKNKHIHRQNLHIYKNYTNFAAIYEYLR